MSKKSPSTSVSPAPEQSPSKESWIMRHRGKIALLLGLQIGVAAGLKINLDGRKSKSAHRWLPTTSVQPDSKQFKAQPERDPASEYIQDSLPPCELREGTFLADSLEMEDECRRRISAREECRCPTTLAAIWGDSEVENMKSGAINFLHRQDEENTAMEGSDPTCGIYSDSSEGEPVEDFVTFDKLPDPYKDLLAAFDPEANEAVRQRVLIYAGEEKSGKLHKEEMGQTSGPFAMVCGRLILSDSGQYYSVVMDRDLEQIDIGAAVREKDDPKIRQFVRTAATLSHEAFGHVRNKNRQRGKMDAQESLLFSVMDEIYAHYVTGRMLDFLCARHPYIREIMEKDISDVEKVKASIGEADVCSIGLEAIEEKVDALENETMIEEGMLFRSYLKAKEKRDWKEFKDEVLVHYFSAPAEFAGLPYIMAYLRDYGQMEKLEGLNGAMKRIMSSESPEKFFTK